MADGAIDLGAHAASEGSNPNIAEHPVAAAATSPLPLEDGRRRSVRTRRPLCGCRLKFCMCNLDDGHGRHGHPADVPAVKKTVRKTQKRTPSSVDSRISNSDGGNAATSGAHDLQEAGASKASGKQRSLTECNAAVVTDNGQITLDRQNGDDRSLAVQGTSQDSPPEQNLRSIAKDLVLEASREYCRRSKCNGNEVLNNAEPNNDDHNGHDSFLVQHSHASEVTQSNKKTVHSKLSRKRPRARLCDTNDVHGQAQTNIGSQNGDDGLISMQQSTKDGHVLQCAENGRRNLTSKGFRKRPKASKYNSNEVIHDDQLINFDHNGNDGSLPVQQRGARNNKDDKQSSLSRPKQSNNLASCLEAQASCQLLAKRRWKELARQMLNAKDVSGAQSELQKHLSHNNEPNQEKASHSCQKIVAQENQTSRGQRRGKLRIVTPRSRSKEARVHAIKAKTQERFNKQRMHIVNRMKVWLNQAKATKKISKHGIGEYLTKTEFVVTKEDRDNFAQSMVKYLQENPKMCSLFLDSVKIIANSGLVHSPALTLLQKKGFSAEAEVLIQAWESYKLQQSLTGGFPMDFLKSVAQLDEKIRLPSSEDPAPEDSPLFSFNQNEDKVWQFRLENAASAEESKSCTY